MKVLIVLIIAAIAFVAGTLVNRVFYKPPEEKGMEDAEEERLLFEERKKLDEELQQEREKYGSTSNFDYR